MEIRKKYSVQVVTVLLLGITILSSCNHDRNHPGWAYMPDMYYSEASEAYSENAVFKDGVTNQLPVEGTISRGHIPYPYDKSADDQKLAGIELMNPIALNDENLARGKEQYEIFCSSCHGVAGDGKGHLFTSGLYLAMPTPLIQEYVQIKPDGELFHIITMGSLSGLMGAHGSQIERDDRWRIIQYIRTELVKK
jgi:hypothetical protein